MDHLAGCEAEASESIRKKITSHHKLFLDAAPKMPLRHALRMAHETRSGVIHGAAAGKYPMPCVWQRPIFHAISIMAALLCGPVRMQIKAAVSSPPYCLLIGSFHHFSD